MALLVFRALLAGPGLGATKSELGYSGYGSSDPATSVSFQVDLGPRGKKLRVRFQASDVELICDDGSVQRVSIPEDTYRFRGRKSFSAEHYLFDDTVQQYTEVSGRLVAGGQAKGYLVFIADVFPAPPGSAAYPDCSTHGKVRWTAQRVDG